MELRNGKIESSDSSESDSEEEKVIWFILKDLIQKTAFITQIV